MAKKMKICPLLTIASRITETNDFKKCEGDKCAFYCDWNKMCAVTSLSSEVGNGLESIRNRLP